MAKRYSGSDIHNLSQRSVFFDANVLLYIFWPTGSSWERQYSSIFRHLLQQKTRMVVDFLVISEVVNRAVKTEYNKHLQENNITGNELRYKEFRDKTEGREALRDIFHVIDKNILRSFDVAGKAFSKSDITGFLNVDTLDFVDKGIEAICRENDYVLLTNDKDYINSDLEIISSNPVFSRV
ncbi:MAG TPA: twitching motility protein PilT [Spirochaetota bacterium]|nr:twitching motility protein PilT [Spirochaetota bacterium]